MKNIILKLCCCCLLTTNLLAETVCVEHSDQTKDGDTICAKFDGTVVTVTSYGKDLSNITAFDCDGEVIKKDDNLSGDVHTLTSNVVIGSVCVKSGNNTDDGGPCSSLPGNSGGQLLESFENCGETPEPSPTPTPEPSPTPTPEPSPTPTPEPECLDCLDCLGVLNGNAKVDACGVCQGPGTDACGLCPDSDDHGQLLCECISIDLPAHELDVEFKRATKISLQLINQSRKILVKTGKLSKAQLKRIKKQKQIVSDIHIRSWHIAWGGIGESALLCTVDSTCQTVDLLQPKSTLLSDSATLNKLAKQNVNLIAKLGNKKAQKTMKKLNKLLDGIRELLKTVPDSKTVC